MLISYARVTKLLDTTVKVTSSDPDDVMSTVRLPLRPAFESDPMEELSFSTLTVTIVTSAATHV